MALGALAGPPAAAESPANDELAVLQRAFTEHSGARLVFDRSDLPGGTYHDVMPALAPARAVRAARIALAEARKYPRGYLGDIGLRSVGVFAACVSRTGDGHRPYEEKLGGYRYFGIWNGANAVAAAYYTDEQLPLTFHHEVFHHVDATVNGVTAYAPHFTSDDAAFTAAIEGTRRYRAPPIHDTDLRALRHRAEGYELRGAVGSYASKSVGEDQAETARYLMTALPDAFVQIVADPELPGSQRMLHVLATYERSLPDGPGADWFVDVALDRASAMRARITGDGGRFVVWGAEDGDGVNWTLRADLQRFGQDAARLERTAAAAGDSDAALARTQLGNLRLLARYRAFIERHWALTAGTADQFDTARRALIDGLPASRAPLARALARLDWSQLAGVLTTPTLDAADRTTAIVGRAAARGVAVNPYVDKVDAEVSDPGARAAVRAMHPATVRLDRGSGVNIGARGVVLTAAHVAKRRGAELTALFPDGSRYTGVCTAIDHHLDLAIIELGTTEQLPVAAVAAAAPRTGDWVATIGQPGGFTPDGDPTGYQPFHVSAGAIRGFHGDDRLAAQSLGGTMHDAWTYWGHSGSPIVNRHGAIVALHNSWDSRTAMRHAVTWEAIVDFLARAKLGG